MAQKKKTASESTSVTRITASDTGSPRSRAKKVETQASEKKKAATATAPAERNFFGAIAGYFKGSWEELKQVRWPNRKTTWALTLAVLIFTAFFFVLILALDFFFQWLFDFILA